MYGVVPNGPHLIIPFWAACLGEILQNWDDDGTPIQKSISAPVSAQFLPRLKSKPLFLAAVLGSPYPVILATNMLRMLFLFLYCKPIYLQLIEIHDLDYIVDGDD